MGKMGEMPGAHVGRSGASMGNRAPPPRNLENAGYAGARSANIGVSPEWMSKAVAPTKRLEQEFSQAKTKSDARTMVANMVAERLALCGFSSAVSTPVLGAADVDAMAAGGGPFEETPVRLTSARPTPARQTPVRQTPACTPPPATLEAYAAPAAHGAGTTFYRKPAVNAVVSAAVGAVTAAVSASPAPPPPMTANKPA